MKQFLLSLLCAARTQHIYLRRSSGMRIWYECGYCGKHEGKGITLDKMVMHSLISRRRTAAQVREEEEKEKRQKVVQIRRNA